MKEGDQFPVGDTGTDECLELRMREALVCSIAQDAQDGQVAALYGFLQ